MTKYYYTDQYEEQGQRYLRRVEDVEYWRQRAGWFNDDESMKAYNEGVSTSEGSSGGGSSSSSAARVGKEAAIVKNVIKILSIVVALGLSILMFRAIMRRMSSDPETTTAAAKDKKRSESRTRSSSVRRSRSRSRSRKGDYDLMGDDDNKSRKSTRSKSSSRRSRSRSRHGDSKRSRSKGRSSSDKKPPVLPPTAEPPIKETVLV